jgi:hypothetical protein
VAIKTRHFLNFNCVNSVSTIPSFSYDFFDEASIKRSDFMEECAAVLERLATGGMGISGFTTDGCRYQRKYLNWRDSVLLPATFSEE